MGAFFCRTERTFAGLLSDLKRKKEKIDVLIVTHLFGIPNNICEIKKIYFFAIILGINSQNIIIKIVKQIVAIVVPNEVFSGLNNIPIIVIIEDAKILTTLLPNKIAEIDSS